MKKNKNIFSIKNKICVITGGCGGIGLALSKAINQNNPVIIFDNMDEWENFGKDWVTDVVNQPIDTLSKGYKRRVGLAQALIHDPEILILDEPTAGVDVELRKNLWENVKELNKLGVTIILTTHYLYEAQEMCDRIGIINKGNLVALNTTQKLLEQIETKKIKFKVKNLNQFEKIKLDGVKFSKINSQIVATYDKSKFKFDQIIDVVKNNAEILDISTDDGDLEDVFIRLTKN